jgi:hypothetical protein
LKRGNEVWRRRGPHEFRAHEKAPFLFVDELMIGENVRAVPQQQSRDVVNEPGPIVTIDEESLRRWHVDEGIWRHDLDSLYRLRQHLKSS